MQIHCYQQKIEDFEENKNYFEEAINYFLAENRMSCYSGQYYLCRMVWQKMGSKLTIHPNVQKNIEALNKTKQQILSDHYSFKNTSEESKSYFKYFKFSKIIRKRYRKKINPKE